MKELAFTIAQKIAEDKNPDTILICCSILKKAFLLQGYSDRQSNTMAIDGIKIITQTMLNLVKNGK